MKHLLKDKGIQHSTKEIANVFSNRIVMNCIFSQIVECEESFVGFLLGFEIISDFRLLLISRLDECFVFVWIQSVLKWPRLKRDFPWSLLSWSALRWFAQILSRLRE